MDIFKEGVDYNICKENPKCDKFQYSKSGTGNGLIRRKCLAYHTSCKNGIQHKSNKPGIYSCSTKKCINSNGETVEGKNSKLECLKDNYKWEYEKCLNTTNNYIQPYTKHECKNLKHTWIEGKCTRYGNKQSYQTMCQNSKEYNWDNNKCLDSNSNVISLQTLCELPNNYYFEDNCHYGFNHQNDPRKCEIAYFKGRTGVFTNLYKELESSLFTIFVEKVRGIEIGDVLTTEKFWKSNFNTQKTYYHNLPRVKNIIDKDFYLEITFNKSISINDIEKPISFVHPFTDEQINLFGTENSPMKSCCINKLTTCLEKEKNLATRYGPYALDWEISKLSADSKIDKTTCILNNGTWENDNCEGIETKNNLIVDNLTGDYLYKSCRHGCPANKLGDYKSCVDLTVCKSNEIEESPPEKQLGCINIKKTKDNCTGENEIWNEDKELINAIDCRIDRFFCNIAKNKCFIKNKDKDTCTGENERWIFGDRFSRIKDGNKITKGNNYYKKDRVCREKVCRCIDEDGNYIPNLTPSSYECKEENDFIKYKKSQCFTGNEKYTKKYYCEQIKEGTWNEQQNICEFNYHKNKEQCEDNKKTWQSNRNKCIENINESDLKIFNCTCNNGNVDLNNCSIRYINDRGYSMNQCSSCNKGYYLNTIDYGNQTHKEAFRRSGLFRQNRSITCEKCPEGTIQPNNENRIGLISCIPVNKNYKCNNGFKMDTNKNKCVDSDGNTIENQDEETCEANNNTWISANTRVECKACQAGEYLDSIDNTCKECKNNTYSHKGTTVSYCLYNNHKDRETCEANNNIWGSCYIESNKEECDDKIKDSYSWIPKINYTDLETGKCVFYNIKDKTTCENDNKTWDVEKLICYDSNMDKEACNKKPNNFYSINECQVLVGFNEHRCTNENLGTLKKRGGDDFQKYCVANIDKPNSNERGSDEYWKQEIINCEIDNTYWIKDKNYVDNGGCYYKFIENETECTGKGGTWDRKYKKCKNTKTKEECIENIIEYKDDKCYYLKKNRISCKTLDSNHWDENYKTCRSYDTECQPLVEFKIKDQYISHGLLSIYKMDKDILDKLKIGLKVTGKNVHPEARILYISKKNSRISISPVKMPNGKYGRAVGPKAGDTLKIFDNIDRCYQMSTCDKTAKLKGDLEYKIMTKSNCSSPNTWIDNLALCVNNLGENDCSGNNYWNPDLEKCVVRVKKNNITKIKYRKSQTKTTNPTCSKNIQFEKISGRKIKDDIAIEIGIRANSYTDCTKRCLSDCIGFQYDGKQCRNFYFNSENSFEENKTELENNSTPDSNYNLYLKKEVDHETFCKNEINPLTEKNYTSCQDMIDQNKTCKNRSDEYNYIFDNFKKYSQGDACTECTNLVATNYDNIFNKQHCIQIAGKNNHKYYSFVNNNCIGFNDPEIKQNNVEMFSNSNEKIIITTKEECKKAAEKENITFTEGLPSDSGYYYYTGKDSEGNILNDSHPAGIKDHQNGVCTTENAEDVTRDNDSPLYIKTKNFDWDVVENKVCYGKYISPYPHYRLFKYRGKRLGYGSYGNIRLEEAKQRCGEDDDCQAFFRDRSYGYYYYTGKDHEGKILNDSHPAEIKDHQKGVCTRSTAQNENRKTGSTLYIKSYKWKEVNNKVCYGKNISGAETNSSLQKYKGQKIGYGYYGDISLEKAKNKCTVDKDCQSIFSDLQFSNELNGCFKRTVYKKNKKPDVNVYFFNNPKPVKYPIDKEIPKIDNKSSFKRMKRDSIFKITENTNTNFYNCQNKKDRTAFCEGRDCTSLKNREFNCKNKINPASNEKDYFNCAHKDYLEDKCKNKHYIFTGNKYSSCQDMYNTEKACKTQATTAQLYAKKEKEEFKENSYTFNSCQDKFDLEEKCKNFNTDTTYDSCQDMYEKEQECINKTPNEGITYFWDDDKYRLTSCQDEIDTENLCKTFTNQNNINYNSCIEYKTGEEKCKNKSNPLTGKQYTSCQDIIDTEKSCKKMENITKKTEYYLKYGPKKDQNYQFKSCQDKKNILDEIENNDCKNVKNPLHKWNEIEEKCYNFDGSIIKNINSKQTCENYQSCDKMITEIDTCKTESNFNLLSTHDQDCGKYKITNTDECEEAIDYFGLTKPTDFKISVSYQSKGCLRNMRTNPKKIHLNKRSSQSSCWGDYSCICKTEKYDSCYDKQKKEDKCKAETPPLIFRHLYGNDFKFKSCADKNKKMSICNGYARRRHNKCDHGNEISYYTVGSKKEMYASFSANKFLLTGLQKVIGDKTTYEGCIVLNNDKWYTEGKVDKDIKEKDKCETDYKSNTIRKWIKFSEDNILSSNKISVSNPFQAHYVKYYDDLFSKFGGETCENDNECLSNKCKNFVGEGKKCTNKYCVLQKMRWDRGNYKEYCQQSDSNGKISDYGYGYKAVKKLKIECPLIKYNAASCSNE